MNRLSTINETAGLSMSAWWQLVQTLISQIQSPALQISSRIWMDEKITQRLESAKKMETCDNDFLIKLLESRKDDQDWALTRYAGFQLYLLAQNWGCVVCLHCYTVSLVIHLPNLARGFFFLTFFC
jgi:hypothetical protein